MHKQPDPNKAIHVKPQQRTWEREQKRPLSKHQWQPHHGDAALDAWGTALRDMRAQGVSWE